MDFTAIDFETATRRSDSACQLAAVRVRNGQIVASHCWWIRPRPFVFSPANIRIHGITPDRVRDEPEFGEQWPEIQKAIGQDCIIAHHAHFDIGVLLACLQTHRQPVPELSFSCSCTMARRTWPHRPRFGLKPLSDWLGIRFRHHDALEDSIACAKIVIAAAEDRGAESLSALEASLELSRGRAGKWGKRGLVGKTKASDGRNLFGRDGKRRDLIKRTGVRQWQVKTKREESVAFTPSDDDLLQRLLIRGEFTQPLAGNAVVFTGQLLRLSREDAEVLTQSCGGRVQSSVTRRTSLVVVGETDHRTRAAGRSESVKEMKARELREAGAPIRILSENDFWALIESGALGTVIESSSNRSAQ